MDSTILLDSQYASNYWRKTVAPGSNGRAMEWNQPLPSDFQTKFVSWRETLTALGGVNVPRTYDSLVSAVGSPKDLLVFKDASKKAIAADGDN